MLTGEMLGPYRVLDKVGAGGMGEVYRARDSRLDRDVAIKILPPAFAADADRLARFEREAKTLASLNHPNIAAIHGIEEPTGNNQPGRISALVMELVEGEDLSQRIARGAVPIAEALPIARQIADALDAAHERGIIHRDLKPANIKVRDDGTVKVLDFGLAKALDPVAPRGVAEDVSPAHLSPTITSPATQLGMILGTAAYMAPEQAKGKPVDKRADIWAFGCVLYEMLTGKRAFAGSDVSETLASVLARDVDWTALPSQTPASIRRLIHRCLDRDLRKRLPDAGEARFQLEEAMAAPAATDDAAVARRTRWRSLVPWGIAAALAAALLALAARDWRQSSNEAARYSLELPPKATLPLTDRPAIALSPDGATAVFVATVDGVDRLYVRRMGAYEATPIAGTEGASHPVISPDGGSVAFMTSTRLVRVPLGGGAVVTLGSVADPRGLSWDEQDSIVLTPASAGGVFKIAAAGGTPVQLTTPVAPEERTHRWPQLLPGGALMFTVGMFASPDNYDNAVIAAQLPNGTRRDVITGASFGRYVATGDLVFLRGGTLFSVPFDPATAEVKGTPAPVLDGVAGDATTGAAHVSVSRSGSLLYVAADSGALVPTWIDRSGRAERLPLQAGTYADVRISPDGQQAAMTVIAGGGRDIWVYHFERRTFTRMTFGADSLTPVWSRDGSWLYYASTGERQGGRRRAIMRRRSDGSSDAETLVTLDDTRESNLVYLNEIVDGERSAVIEIYGSRGNSQIAKVEMTRDARPVLLFPSSSIVFTGRLSPDGRWLAYVSPESGRPEIYVRSFAGGGRWQVSTSGGEEPKWSADGRHLYYRYNSVLYGVRVETGKAAFEWSAPSQALAGIYNLRTETGISYDVDRQGERFLMVRPAAEATATQSLRLIVNWARELR